MSSSSPKSKSTLKKVSDWLFKPTLEKYEDEPLRPTKTRKAKNTKGTTGTKAGQKKSGKPAKARKKNKVNLADLGVEEQGERIGFIDKKGAVRMKATGKLVGHISGADEDKPDAEILGTFIQKFRDNEAKTLDLVNRQESLGLEAKDEVAALREELKEAAGLGDPAAMIASLDTIDATIDRNVGRVKADKIKVLQRADRLPLTMDSGDIDWNGSDAELATIVDDWRESGDVGTEAQAVLDERYEATLAAYSARKEKFFTDFDANRADKEKLVRRAKSLAQLNDVDLANQEFAQLSRHWKSVGPASVDDEIRLKAEFNRAQKSFLDIHADELAATEDRKSFLAGKKATLGDEIHALSNLENPAQLSSAIHDKDATLRQIETTLGTDDQTRRLNAELDVLSGKLDTLKKETAAAKKARADRAGFIANRAKELAEADKHNVSWKDADEELRSLADEAKGLKSISRDEKQALDADLGAARRDFGTNRTAFFERMDEERDLNSARKRALINDLPFYKNGATAADLMGHLNTSMENWKKIGPARREENDALWEEYRGIRSTLFDKVQEQRELEKDDFVARLAFSFEKKKEELYKLETEAGHERMLVEDTGDKKKAARLASLVDRKELRIKGLQKDVLDIQRKLAKMSGARKKAESTPESVSQSGPGAAIENREPDTGSDRNSEDQSPDHSTSNAA